MSRRAVLHLIVTLFAAFTIIALWLSSVYGQVTPAQFESWYPNFGRYVFLFIYYIGILKHVLQVLLVVVVIMLMMLNRQHIHYLWHPNARLLYITLFITFLLAEIILRTIFSYKPGVHTYSQWFTEVDSLYSLSGFTADSTGIYKVSPEVEDYYRQRLSDSSTPEYNYRTVSIEAWCLEGSFGNPVIDTASTELARAYRTQLQKPVHDEWGAALLHYIKNPINSHGFRSIPFTPYNGPRKKILLLGDSFTWGHSTQNITSSFADILLARGYMVYNTGISGADPEQYRAIAEQYVPLLQPDYVVVNLFMGNDIQYYERPVKPFMPFHYATNAGNLSACPHSTYFSSPQQAYHFVKAHYRIPAHNLTNRLLSVTATGTLVWKILYKGQWVDGIPQQFRAYWQQAGTKKQIEPVCNKQVEKIQQLCNAHNAQLLVMVMPELRWGSLVPPQSTPGLLQNIHYHVPPVNEADYKQADGHYNEAGHKIHAETIMQLLN